MVIFAIFKLGNNNISTQNFSYVNCIVCIVPTV